MAKVFLPKGTRDLMPATMNHRLAVMEIIRKVFTKYGFEPMETPAFERIETLTGKAGENEKLMFRILKRGEGGLRGEVDQGLRYDLTVPLARVVAMNPSIPLPFKRSQIQPVWRADRPQKGRFREFYQCDIDTVGTASPIADAECIAVVHDALMALGLTGFTIRVNHRQLLRSMAESIGAGDNETAVIQALDKLDKVGRKGVEKELLERGFTADQCTKLWNHIDGAPIEGAAEAERELKIILGLARDMGVDADRVKIDRTLARGLDYYTGPVFEATLEGEYTGSISGGGRYDGLIGMFSGKADVPAVGISLGIERIFMLMEEMGLLPTIPTTTQVWVTVFSDDTRSASLEAATQMRSAGVNVQVSTRTGKLAKQFKDANGRGIPYVLVCGPDEAANGTVVLKNLSTGEQWTGPADQAASQLT
ncbi:MAG: histidine--tRNA ligase [Myxococcota bacterium]